MQSDLYFITIIFHLDTTESKLDRRTIFEKEYQVNVMNGSLI